MAIALAVILIPVIQLSVVAMLVRMDLRRLALCQKEHEAKYHGFKTVPKFVVE